MKQLSMYLECAAVCGTHGVRGTVRLENRCDTPQKLASLKRMFAKEKSGEYKEYTVRSSSVHKNMVLTGFEDIDTVEDAAAMRGTVLYALREDLALERGKVFIADMLGLPVIDSEDGTVLGTLKDVIQPGAQQIYVVSRDGGEFMIPAVPEFIKEVSLGDGDRPEGVYVKLIEGMTEN